MLNFLNGTVSNQIYFVYGLIGLVLVLILTIILMDYKDKNKANKKAKQIEKDARKENSLAKIEIPLLETIPLVENVIEEFPSRNIDEITYADENPELERTNAQLELQKLTEELQKAESENNNNIDLTIFEEEQESNAIISIQDLLKRNSELYEHNEDTQYKDEGNEPINIEELKKKFEVKDNTPSPSPSKDMVIETVINTEEKAPVYKQVVLDDFITGLDINAKNEPTRVSFKSTPFISPIYGIEKEPIIEKDSPTHEEVIELEQTADLEQLDGEIRKTNEFLKVLKELQKDLN